MGLPAFAWGNQNLYRLPDDQGHVFGREFEMLPAGTMFAAGVLLHGVIGVEAEPAHEGHCYIADGARLLIIGSRGTTARELEAYQEDIVDGYRNRQAAQG